jgi:hypothetical protein
VPEAGTDTEAETEVAAPSADGETQS